MTAIWPLSRAQQFDAGANPLAGGKLYFFDSGTTTPQVVFGDSSLSTPLDQPILADALGRFVAIYLNPDPGSYRHRLTDANDVVIFDDDGISVPQDADYVPPDAGETAVELLFRTGMRQGYYGTSAPSGWVRAAGRTIGSASSGATERANADCEDLFLHLWTVDSTLAVSGGRGGSAAGDWAANKTIALPDYRDRVSAGLATMGNSDVGLIADSKVDNTENSSTLGATATPADAVATSVQISAREFIQGLTLTNGSDATNDIDIAAGQATDDTVARILRLASGITKRLDASWAVGSGNGGLDTGSIANTTYHLWLIMRSDTGVVDVLFSASATSPTMPANYDYKRRIGSVVRSGGALKAFYQVGNEFWWTDLVADLNTTTASTTGTELTLTVPSGIQVLARVVQGLRTLNTNGNPQYFLLNSLSQNNTTPSLANATAQVAGAASHMSDTSELEVLTNTSAQVRQRIDSNDSDTNVLVLTQGWNDHTLGTRTQAAATPVSDLNANTMQPTIFELILLKL